MFILGIATDEKSGYFLPALGYVIGSSLATRLLPQELEVEKKCL